MNVAEYISSFLKKNKINKVFMLTGYGAMYLNDAIKKANIKYYATRCYEYIKPDATCI